MLLDVDKIENHIDVNSSGGIEKPSRDHKPTLVSGTAGGDSPDCDYKCKSNGGCSVTYTGPLGNSRHGATKVNIFSYFSAELGSSLPL